MTRKEIILYDSSHAKKFADLIIQKIASGFQFTEGPVWHPDQYLLFSDTPVNKIWQLLPDKTVQVYLDKSGLSNDDVSALSDMIGSNGLAIDDEGALVICQHGNHGLARLEKTGEITILVNGFEGHPLNSPNDLVLHSDGTIYFTDPPNGLKNQILHPSAFQTFAGIYRYKNGKLDLLSDDLRYPNGICFSPGENYLYVSSNHPDEPFLWRFELSPSGEMKHQSILIQQNADGITADKEGNLLLCTDRGILFVSLYGKRIALIPLPVSPTNIAWGGKDRNELYITARSDIYLVTGYDSG
ncbi:MAG: SMP-30/gluconolactonase/LRE family protein [Chitinophagaceae bacterium]